MNSCIETELEPTLFQIAQPINFDSDPRTAHTHNEFFFYAETKARYIVSEFPELFGDMDICFTEFMQDVRSLYRIVTREDHETIIHALIEDIIKDGKDEIALRFNAERETHLGSESFMIALLLETMRNRGLLDRIKINLVNHSDMRKYPEVFILDDAQYSGKLTGTKLRGIRNTDTVARIYTAGLSVQSMDAIKEYSNKSVKFTRLIPTVTRCLPEDKLLLWFYTFFPGAPMFGPIDALDYMRMLHLTVTDFKVPDHKSIPLSALSIYLGKDESIKLFSTSDSDGRTYPMLLQKSFAF